MRTIALTVLLFVALAGVAQITSGPQVPFSGSIGPGGIFPLFHNGTIVMSGSSYSMTPLDTTAEIIRVTSSVSLSGTGLITAPSSAMGFEYVFLNATTGGQPIQIRGASGTGVTIPNGQAMMVVFDGTNYVPIGNAAGGGIQSLNGLSGPNLTLANGGGISISPSGSTITLTNTGGGTGTGGGWGNVVPGSFTTIQSAISAGGGPVVVLPSSTDQGGFNNLTNMRILNFKMTAVGWDSLFTRDVSEWGVIDGEVLGYCHTTANSNVIGCAKAFVNAPAPAGDVGKLVIVAGSGLGTYGQITSCYNNSCALTVTSTAGLTPGTPNTWQGIMFTDPGDCYTNPDGTPNWDTQPYGHIWLDASGLPSGIVNFPNFWGKGCTHPPTVGQINTVGGTVHFTGGGMAPGDFVSVITSVTGGGSNLATVADVAPYDNSGGAYIGSDAHDTLEAACNGVSTGNFVTSGILTFSGIALVSHGVDCNSAGLHLVGRSQLGLSSAIVYAGKTPNPPPSFVLSQGNDYPYPQTYILNLAYGGGAKVERIHLVGNSQAMPYALVNSFGDNGWNIAPGSGRFIGQLHVVDQVTMGNYWGDPLYDLQTPRLQSCVLWAGWTGNADFTSLDHIYCYGADVGMDSVNDQATGIRIGKWQSEFNNFGITTSGALDMQEYYTEYNRCDFYIGSPYWPAGVPNWGVHFGGYGGESSGMAMCGASYPSYNIVADSYGLGGPQDYFGRPDGITDDFLNHQPPMAGSITIHGGARGNVLLPFFGGGGPNFEFLDGFQSNQFRFAEGLPPYGPGYNQNGWAAGHLKITGPNLDLDIPNQGTDWLADWLVPGPLLGSPGLMMMKPVTSLAVQDKSQVIYGSLEVRAPYFGIGWGNWLGTFCNGSVQQPGQAGYTPCGTATYRYQVTCSDSLGNESLPSFDYSGGSGYITTVTAAASPLTSSNYNFVSLHPRTGCPVWNLYGDNGVGGCIGFLHSATEEEMAYPWGSPTGALDDHGLWSKNCARTVPTTEAIGSVTAAGIVSAPQMKITGLPNEATLGTDAQGNIIPGSGSGGPGGGITAINSQTGPGITITGTGTVGVTQAANTITINGTGGGGAAFQPNAIQFATSTTAARAATAADIGALGVLSNSTNGSAATAASAVVAQSLAANPSLCAAGSAPRGIIANGNATGCAPITGGGGGSTALSALTPATGDSSLNNQDYKVQWLWSKTGGQADYGLFLGESSPSPSAAVILDVETLSGSLAWPLWVSAQGRQNGVGLDPQGALWLTALPNAASLATDPQGKVIAGTGGGGSTALNTLTAASASHSIDNQNNDQNWLWNLSANTWGMHFGESAPSTAGAVILQADTLPGSVAWPFWAYAHTDDGTHGFGVDPNGNVFIQTVKNATLATDQYGQVIAASGGPGGGSTAWSSLTNPTAPVTLDLGANQTHFISHGAGPGALAFQYDDETTSAAGAGDMIYMWSNSPKISPLEIQVNDPPTYSGFFVNGSDGSIEMQGSAKLRGPVQLAGVPNATSLATDGGGNIIAGSGGAPVSSGGVSSGVLGWIPNTAGVISAAANNVGGLHFRWPGYAGTVSFSRIVLQGATADSTNPTGFAIWDVTNNRMVCHTVPFIMTQNGINTLTCSEGTVQITGNTDYMFLGASGGVAQQVYGTTNYRIATRLVSTNFANCTYSTANGITCSSNFNLATNFTSNTYLAVYFVLY